MIVSKCVSVLVLAVVMVLSFQQPLIYTNDANEVIRIIVDGKVLAYDKPMPSILVLPDNQCQVFDPKIKELARSITKDAKTDYDKAKAVHDWVARNIAYDDDGDKPQDALSVLERKNGLCRGYAYLTASLLRSVGIPTAVTRGNAPTPHSWNTALVDGRWITIDTTWDAGYVRNGTFIRNYRDTYFDPTPEFFNRTHDLSFFAFAETDKGNKFIYRLP